MIKPINRHVLIEPVKQESFIASNRDTYQEIGIIVDSAADLIEVNHLIAGKPVLKGYKVYFDAWLAKKYPKEGSPDEFFWLVRWDDIVAYEES